MVTNKTPTDTGQKEAEAAPLLYHDAGTLHPTERTASLTGTRFVREGASVLRLDRWIPPSGDRWTALSLRVKCLHEGDETPMVWDSGCSLCLSRTRHTAALCSWLKAPLPLTKDL